MGLDHPAQAPRDLARKGYGQALYKGASLSLFDAPVDVEPPQEAAVFPNRQLPLSLFPCILHFCNPGADRPPCPPVLRDLPVTCLVFRVEHCREHLLLQQPLIAEQGVTVTAQELGIDDLRIPVLVAVVVLKDLQDPGSSGLSARTWLPARYGGDLPQCRGSWWESRSESSRPEAPVAAGDRRRSTGKEACLRGAF